MRAKPGAVQCNGTSLSLVRSPRCTSLPPSCLYREEREREKEQPVALLHQVEVGEVARVFARAV